MKENGIKALLSAALHYNANRHHLDSSDTAARHYALIQAGQLSEATKDTHRAQRQHEMLRGGLCSIVNRMRDTDPSGNSYHYRTLDDVEFALVNLIQRYEESCGEDVE